jgi:hypothetical protein
MEFAAQQKSNTRNGTFSQPESVFPALRNIHVRAIQLSDRWATEQAQCAIQINPQDLDGAVDASFTGGC